MNDTERYDMSHRRNTARNDYKQGNIKEGQQQGQQTKQTNKDSKR
jgi:hypothetical protein